MIGIKVHILYMYLAYTENLCSNINDMTCVNLLMCVCPPQALAISSSLDSLLGAMCEEDPELRASLMQVLEVSH